LTLTPSPSFSKGESAAAAGQVDQRNGSGDKRVWHGAQGD